MKEGFKLHYHPSDKDADIVESIIVKAVDDAIDWFSTPSAIIPKGFAQYMERKDASFNDCCRTSLNKVLGDDMKGGFDDTFIEPAAEGGWGDIKEMSLEDYVDRIARHALNDIISSSFVQYWLDDLKKYDRPGLAELMVKVNMRLILNVTIQCFEIREEVIEQVYFYLRRMAFDD